MASASQIDRLGERLRSGVLSDADEQMLHEFLQAHDRELAAIVATLREISMPDGTNLAPTSRVKTRSTLIEKLAREKSRLSSVHDVAGARIVAGDTLDEQERVRDLIVAQFPEARVIDRRLDQRSGYRAIHVIVRIGGCWAEIQVRTSLQHLWAEAFERLADKLGRDIRYGGIPAPDANSKDRLHRLETILKFSAQIEVLEDSVRWYRRLRAGYESGGWNGEAPASDEVRAADLAVFDELGDRLVRLSSDFARHLQELRDTMEETWRTS